MSNRYANLVGSNKIKDEWQKINTGFDQVEQEMDEKPDKSIAQVNDIELDADDLLTVEGGTGITVTTVPEEKKVRITATGEATPGPHGIEHNHDGADPIPELVQARNDLSAHIAMLATDAVRPHGMGRIAAQDYEEGTWTPSLIGSTEPGSNSYSTRIGRYVRIGNAVFFTAHIVLTAKDTNMAGEVVLDGIPFPIDGNAYAFAVGNYSDLNMTSGSGLIALTWGTNIRFRKTSQNNSSSLDSSEVTGSTWLVVSGMYRISS